MNWRVAFNYACVYLRIFDARHSSVSVLRGRFQENLKYLTQFGVSVVFIYARKNVTFERDFDKMSLKLNDINKAKKH